MVSRSDFVGKPKTEERKLSQAIWCDTGKHAFSEKDPDRQHFAQTRQVRVKAGNSFGEPIWQDRKEVTEELDVCGPCWRKQNLFLEAASPDSEETKPSDS